GLAKAKIKGLLAMRFTISGFSTPPAERPKNTSASLKLQLRYAAQWLGQNFLSVCPLVWCAPYTPPPQYLLARYFLAANQGQPLVRYKQWRRPPRRIPPLLSPRCSFQLALS